jgi:hypothetical protein
MSALVILAALVGAAGFRLRGSAAFERITGRGATTARLVCWAVPVALVAWTSVEAWAAAILAAALYLGAVPGWWRSLSLGRNPRDGAWLDAAARHTARGLVWAAPAAAVVGGLGGAWWGVLLAGAAVVAPYEAGWRLAPDHAVEVGEAGFGAMLAAAIVASLPLWPPRCSSSIHASPC